MNLVYSENEKKKKKKTLMLIIIYNNLIPFLSLLEIVSQLMLKFNEKKTKPSKQIDNLCSESSQKIF